MKKRIRTHTNPLSIRQRLTEYQVNWDQYNAYYLEIGFGKGRFMHEYAKNNPQDLMIGVEVRKQMVIQFKEKPALSNCLPIWGNATICLEDVVQDNVLDRVFIFHPDPWFKKRHHKRRVIDLDLIQLIKTKLKKNGLVFISTDVYELYDDIMQVLLKNNDKIYTSNHAFWKTDYQTHWSQYSVIDQRSMFTVTFQFKEDVC